MIFAVPATSEFGRKPQVTVVCPNTGPSAGGTPVTITGKNLKDAASVAFGATPLGGGDFTVVSDTEIQTTSPAGTSAVNVTVSTSSATSNGEPYTYVATPTDVQAMMTLAALAANASGARPSGEAPADQAARILLGIGSQLADASLATGANWIALWVGLTQDGANLVYTAENTASSSPQLAVCLRGTVAGSPIDSAEDTNVGSLLAFNAGGTPPAPISISQGAMEAFTEITMGTTLLQTVATWVGAQSTAPVISVCGHSLGGALATTVGLFLQTQTFSPAPTFQVYTFAAPTAGDQAFAEWFDTQFPTATCVWNAYDAVPNAWWNLMTSQGAKSAAVETFYPGMGGGLTLTKTVEGVIKGMYQKTGTNVYVQPTQQSPLNASFGCHNPDPSAITTFDDWVAEAGYQHNNNTYLALLGATPLPAVTPTVASISPTGGAAAGGDQVTISAGPGVVFTPDSVVDFGILPGSNVSVINDGAQISAVSPAGVGTVDVRVTNRFGTSAVVPQDQFAYEVPAG
jgi:hypothetical protein